MTDPTFCKIELPTRRSTIHLAKRVARTLEPGDLVVLSGELGTGKTFFARGLARALGLPCAVPVTSPTFALMQELETTPPVVHADLYRLGGKEECRELGLLDARLNGSVLLVEWGAPFIEPLGGDALHIELGRSPRLATLSSSGTRSGAHLEALQALLPLPLPRKLRHTS